jgi:hypothetical protein
MPTINDLLASYDANDMQLRGHSFCLVGIVMLSSSDCNKAPELTVSLDQREVRMEGPDWREAKVAIEIISRSLSNSLSNISRIGMSAQKSFLNTTIDFQFFLRWFD